MASPRWIENTRFDSAAGYIAYELWFKKKLERHTLEEVLDLYGIGTCLPCIVHRPVEETPYFPYTAMKTCRGVDCSRCKQGRSGYTFRWFSPHWMKDYAENKRKDSWAPGDDES